jgi:hypothetical protein
MVHDSIDVSDIGAGFRFSEPHIPQVQEAARKLPEDPIARGVAIMREATEEKTIGPASARPTKAKAKAHA